MNINKYIDHTMLKPFAKAEDIEKTCREALRYDFAAVCVNSCRVSDAARLIKGSGIHLSGAIGFPFGTQTIPVKALEAKGAIADGADEIDMLINIGKLLEDDEAYVEEEVSTVTDIAHNEGAVIKIITETCYLDETHIAAICRIIEKAGADFIKTSTGYGTRGASTDDIRLFHKYLKGDTLIKASGGIRDLDTALSFIELGCARIGTSAGVSIVTAG